MGLAKVFKISIWLSLISNLAFADNQYDKFMVFEKLPNTAFFEGNIETGDSFELRKLLRNHEIDTLVLISSGGSVWEALTIAGVVHDNNFNVYIPKDAECYSACSFIFFAGKSRLSNGKLGVHQFSSVDTNSARNVGEVEGGTQFTTSEIIGFLNEFGTPAWVFEKMFAQQEMYVFNSTELASLERGIFGNIQGTNIEQFISQKKLRMRNKIPPKPKPQWTYKNATVYLTSVSGEWVYDDSGYKNTWRILVQNDYDYNFINLGFEFKVRACDRYSKNTVLQVQNALRKDGIDVGTPDGLFGNKTASGIKSFQRRTGLKVTGNINFETLSLLKLDDDSEYIQGPIPHTLTFPIPKNKSVFIDIPYLYGYTEGREFCYLVTADYLEKVRAN